ncbi:hypothetical protein F2Q68_00017120 [Brassica cretica]|uniref:Serine-threonine/tyrosine-protein kinase catalytic domain-containing protein n=2 Tax=Brassica cretica TaxID=69181 RepID=A0A8S9HMV7_BRACR|nr:hypothetical protein F2Q68_00017120 [Brassica cretica]KAF3607846.1 hypothetical protein DY000_02049706 [Brassica cretica]
MEHLWQSNGLKKKSAHQEKKLEMLVDPDMHVNYTEAQLEQLIQVALLCTQSSPLQRPMMSDFVRMLEDDQVGSGAVF